MDDSAYFASTGFYVNPAAMIAIAVLFSVLGAIFVIARFVIRSKYRMRVMTDDWLCIPALILIIAQGVLYIYGAEVELLGYRVRPGASPAIVKAAVNTQDPSNLRMLEFACNILSAVSTGLIRLSFLFFYRRIFRGNTFNIVSWSMIALTIAWTVAMFITYMTICPYYFNSGITSKQSCGRMLYFLGAYSITGFALDLLILIMPFPWIWKLNLPMSQKWAVTSVFLCGSFTVAASCVRMVCGIFVMLDKPGQYSNLIGLRSYGDIVGGAGVWLFWSYIENGTGLLVACMPSLAPFFRHRLSKSRLGPYDTEARMNSENPPKALAPSSTRSYGAKDSQRSVGLEPDQPFDVIMATHTVEQYRVPM